MPIKYFDTQLSPGEEQAIADEAKRADKDTLSFNDSLKTARRERRAQGWRRRLSAVTLAGSIVGGIHISDSNGSRDTEEGSVDKLRGEVPEQIVSPRHVGVSAPHGESRIGFEARMVSPGEKLRGVIISALQREHHALPRPIQEALDSLGIPLESVLVGIPEGARKIEGSNDWMMVKDGKNSAGATRRMFVAYEEKLLSGILRKERSVSVSNGNDIVAEIRIGTHPDSDAISSVSVSSKGEVDLDGTAKNFNLHRERNRYYYFDDFSESVFHPEGYRSLRGHESRKGINDTNKGEETYVRYEMRTRKINDADASVSLALEGRIWSGKGGYASVTMIPVTHEGQSAYRVVVGDQERIVTYSENVSQYTDGDTETPGFPSTQAMQYFFKSLNSKN